MSSPGSLFYFAPVSLPRSRYLGIGAMGIHEMMPRGYIRHGGPDWPFYLLMHFHSPALIRDAKGRETKVGGQTILWEPFSDHVYGSPWARWDHSWLNIHGSGIDDIVAAERLPVNVPLAFAFTAQFEQYAGMLYTEVHRRSRQDVVMIESIMRMWLHELAMAMRGTERGDVPEALVRARQHIESHYQEPLSLSDLMEVSNLSASQLSALFRRHFHAPPIDYLIGFRIKRAELLLANENLTISEIADRCGFDDPLYFSRQFRRRLGTSPSGFRVRSIGSPPLDDPPESRLKDPAAAARTARTRTITNARASAPVIDPLADNGHPGGVETPLVELRQLTKSYGRREAVRGLSFSLERGGIVGLLGPNGAGKSTTISMLTGLLSPTGGDILWEGRSIYGRMREWRRALGVVLEDLSLFEYLSVREHLTLTGRLAGLDAAETESRSGELVDMLRLGDFTDTIAAEASQGTRKKLALALGLIHAPRILLLDEALNGIDAVTVSVVKQVLRSLAGRGITVILSSHVLDSVETIADRCLIMDRGVVALDARIAGVRASGKTLEQVYTETLTGGARAAPELSWIG